MNRRRAVWIGVAVVIIVPLVLMIDTSPSVPITAAPTAEQVQGGRAAFQRLRTALAGPPPASRATFSGHDLNDIAGLVGNVGRFDRVAAGIAGGQARAAASIGLPLGLWLNLRAAAVPTPAGLPRITARVGDVPIPAWLARAGVEMAATVLRWRGAKLPPLDQLVQGMTIQGDMMTVLVRSPVLDTGLVQDMVAVATTPADARRTAAIYCNLAAQQRQSPSSDLAVQLARAMGAADPATTQLAVAENRAALVAVAMLAVNKNVGRLAGNAGKFAAECNAPSGALQLATRADLAKHWSLSAALGATAGDDLGRAMGNWKELSDSLPGGSGFSFVDLAADRAGLGVGRAGVDPARALGLRKALRGAENARLLPLDAKALSEGMSNADFVARYGDINSADFRARLEKIDALLKAHAVLGSE